jgi:AmmeMemoRadiSam system protein A
MGSLRPERPLWLAVISAATAAAHDPRFRPVTTVELPRLEIEVAVLGEPRPLTDPLTFQPGIDGLIVERDRRFGLLLPQVATEHGWGVREMLEATCWKAGLPPDAWQDPATTLLVFQTLRLAG